MMLFFLPTWEKNFDAVVGDVSIVANRTKYVDFSRRYTEMGVRMLVLEKPKAGNAWMFVKPFTKSMWALTIAIFLYNGLIVWLIEKAGDEELKSSSFSSQFGSLVWLSVTALFPIHGEKLRSNLSRVTMVVWLFVALVLIQSYAANLTTMLTVTQLRPTSPILSSTDYVGCDHGSFVISYLENVLHISKSRIKTYLSGEDYAKALRSGEIKAAFLELAFIKIFLDENKRGFAATGPTYEIGGYGYAFSKGSPLAENVSDEILRLRESGKLHKLEDHLLMVPSSKSSSSDTGGQDTARLSPDSFWGLFLITFGTSTLALLLFLVSRFHDNWCLKKQHQDEHVLEKDDAANLTPSERAPHTVTGVVVHDPDCWHVEIQQPKFVRSNTC
ncbi:glutamate receptor 2.7-like protein [Cinnamomum micranthum f. kanehirae]|uniref:Glutamate receptor 2.7-like protein n=1 Tax=Cinnamomum micranthum f. kanehirae TaxID=337451 RepID=A0A3S3PTP8_9MAGN|nr:glutamate receptor 2.7-like protein [Cinnamomum micranthum f. kanehirae]